MKYVFKLFKIILFVDIIIFTFFSSRLKADNISINTSEKNSVDISNDLSSYDKLFYPDYYRNHDLLTWDNIVDELKFKIAYLTGKRPVKEYMRCHMFQRRITKFLKLSLENRVLSFDKVDNSFLFDKDSSIKKVLSDLRPPSIFCVFHSIGDVRKDCVIYCDYHGIDYESNYYKNNINKFDKDKPFIISEDIADFILFIPNLLILIIICYFFTKKRNKAR